MHLVDLRPLEKGPRHAGGVAGRREKEEGSRELDRWGGVRVRQNCVL